MGEARGIEGKTRYENSVLPNNVPVVTRLFAKAPKLSTLKINSSEINRAYITFTAVKSSQVAVKKPSIFQMTGGDFSLPEVTVPKLSRSQLAPMQIKPAQIDIVKLSASDVNFLQFNPAQISVLQNDVLKISLTSSISLQQFFCGYSFFFHKYTLVFIGIYHNSKLIFKDHIMRALLKQPQIPYLPQWYNSIWRMVAL